MKKDENGTGEDDEDVTSDDEEVEAEDEEYDLPYGEEDEDEIDGEGNIHCTSCTCRLFNSQFSAPITRINLQIMTMRLRVKRPMTMRTTRNRIDSSIFFFLNNG